MHVRKVRHRTLVERSSNGKPPMNRDPLASSFLESTYEHSKFAPYEEHYLNPLWGVRKFRQYIYYIFHDENYDKASLYVLMFILALIILSTIFYILETVPALSETKLQKDFWEISELIVTVLFTIEYLVRIIVVKNRCRYVIKPMNVVDLLAVLPYYVEKVLPQLPSTSLRVLRIIRLARLGRLRNLFSEYIEVLSRALKNAADEAGPMMLLMIMMEVVLFGTSVYAFENGNHEDGTFASIPDTM
jgi:voltage-gated potassium channel